MNKQQGLILALLVSVAVNLLIAGVIIGRGSLPKPPPAPPPMEWVARDLKPETQRNIMRALRSRQNEFRPLREDMRLATMGVRKAISASEADYDPALLAEALANMRDVTLRYQELVHRSLVEVTADLPREERIAVARVALARAQSGKLPRMSTERR